MTKVTYIGNQPTNESKHIELVRHYHSGTKATISAIQWKFCTLIKRNAKDDLDLILCGDSNDSSIAYLGHWNDGTTSNSITNTICTVLGEDVVKPKGKGIEFVIGISTDIDDCKTGKTSLSPKDFKNVEVLAKKEDGYYDVFYAYANDRNYGSLYLGHLNDGFVE